MTVRPSRKFDVIGVSMISPDGFGHQAAHAGELADLLLDPRAPESAMM